MSLTSSVKRRTKNWIFSRKDIRRRSRENYKEKRKKEERCKKRETSKNS